MGRGGAWRFGTRRDVVIVLVFSRALAVSVSGPGGLRPHATRTAHPARARPSGCMLWRCGRAPRRPAPPPRTAAVWDPDVGPRRDARHKGGNCAADRARPRGFSRPASGGGRGRGRTPGALPIIEADDNPALAGRRAPATQRARWRTATAVEGDGTKPRAVSAGTQRTARHPAWPDWAQQQTPGRAWTALPPRPSTASRPWPRGVTQQQGLLRCVRNGMGSFCLPPASGV